MKAAVASRLQWLVAATSSCGSPKGWRAVAAAVKLRAALSAAVAAAVAAAAVRRHSRAAMVVAVAAAVQASASVLPAGLVGPQVAVGVVVVVAVAVLRRFRRFVVGRRRHLLVQAGQGLAPKVINSPGFLPRWASSAARVMASAHSASVDSYPAGGCCSRHLRVFLKLMERCCRLQLLRRHG